MIEEPKNLPEAIAALMALEARVATLEKNFAEMMEMAPTVGPLWRRRKGEGPLPE